MNRVSMRSSDSLVSRESRFGYYRRGFERLCCWRERHRSGDARRSIVTDSSSYEYECSLSYILSPACPRKRAEMVVADQPDQRSSTAQVTMDDTTIPRAGDSGESQMPTLNLPNATPPDRDIDVSVRAADLAGRQNWQLSPIYRLPNEMFDHVFELAYLASVEKDSDFEEKGASVMDLVQNISLVSKRWREIVFFNPRLWSIIDFPNRLAVKTCIMRSKDAPLRIRLISGLISRTEKSPKTKALEECISILMTCIDRWQSLSHDNLRMETLGLIFAHPVPNLETLQLDAQFGPESKDWASDLSIPDGFFSGKVPRLRRLRLLSCHLPLNPLNYANLMELSLSMIDFNSTMFPLLGVLVACPSLELLRLHYISFFPSLSEAESSALANMSPIDMPRLRELSIVQYAGHSSTRAILASIHPRHSLHLRVVSTCHTIDDLYSILPLYKDLASTLQSLLEIEELAFKFREPYPDLNDSDTCDIRAVSRGGSPNHPPYPLMTLQLFPIESDEETAGSLLGARLFWNIGRDLRLPQLKALKITRLDPGTVGAAMFADVLNHLPSIQLLELISCSPVFVQTLTFTSNWRLCPSLETLQLEHSSTTGEDLLAVVESRTQATDDTTPVRLRLVLLDCSAVDQSSVWRLGEYAEVTITKPWE
ncbi:hypothetical protein BOTBODRAFT_341670 [Botryobasidium botryosum FD-172 SS1]|uniref:Uncharacterized protein n=1 Tax=Botryobasidium botryosum (strain FD-172 SS1) TaxID=930990 RepID=A0A067MF74_BOTB1|nr:hypothetical protein BOTBODRAFT_341670 [Botryobasidium botryosum FD-172 SS1]